MKTKHPISSWRNWPKADQERFRELDAKVKSKIRIPWEDWTWWQRRSVSVAFYSSIARRHAVKSNYANVREKLLRERIFKKATA